MLAQSGNASASPSSNARTRPPSASSLIPPHAWTRRLDREFLPHKPFTVSISEIFGLLSMPIGMARYISAERTAGRVPVMDPFSAVSPVLNQPIMGVPCGGIGGGAITRGWRGDFCRWSILPAGIPSYKIVEANQFSLFSKRIETGETLASVLHSKSNQLPSSSRLYKNWNFDGVKGDKTTYHGSFPLAWTVHDGEPDPDLRLTCTQISPVLPGEYNESSYPCAVFEWKIENLSTFNKEVSLMLSWQNSIGGSLDEHGGHVNSVFKDADYLGVQLRHNYFHNIREGAVDIPKFDPCAMAIATPRDPNGHISYTGRFGPKDADSLQNIWKQFSYNGILDCKEDERSSRRGEAIGAALAVKKTLAPGESCVIPFSVSWDAPIARFSSGDTYYRRYTRFFKRDGTSAPLIATVALKRYPSWRDSQLAWQSETVARTDLPSFYFTALFNELYYIVDGGTVWVEDLIHPFDGQPIDTQLPPDSIGKWFYLEGHEYLMANTYDVHFYASFALIQLWPKIQLSIEREFGKLTASGLDPKKHKRTVVMGGTECERAVKYAVPHDIGNPGEAPWKLPNSYPIHACDQWRDLGPKFILQLARDFNATKDLNHLKSQWEVAVAVMERCLREFDENSDGMIENSGHPDTTYDVWTATGTSAYTGGVWLAACKAMSVLSKSLNNDANSKKWIDVFTRGHKVYMEKLWNGNYFKYDELSAQSGSSIHSDQLAGQWYAMASGLGEIIDKEKAEKVLTIILENNVRKFNGGKLGAVNGFFPAPLNSPDNNSMQARESWTGVTYGLAATMVHHGMIEEAVEVLEGFVNTMYNELGYIYATPEAINSDGSYRSIAYMRPLSIWAVQMAFDQRSSNK